MAFTTLEVPAAVRGFHVYRASWQPEENEILECYHEQGNIWDIFAIKTCQSNSVIPVGHLPMELSRLTKFLLDRGAVIKAQLTSSNYRRSPLVQGGLEIECKIIIRMLATRKNKDILDRYKKMHNENYSECDVFIMGSFTQSSPIASSSSFLPSSLPSVSSKSATKAKKHVENAKKKASCDIRTFFRANDIDKQIMDDEPQMREDDSEETDVIVVLD